MAIAALIGLGSLAPAGDAGETPRSYYVSLGDSLAQGWQPDASGHSRRTNRGYVDFVARYLSRKEANLVSVKLGCGGETTTTMMRGGICSYGAGSELAEAVHVLRAHRGNIAAVTVNIGDNDVEQCLTQGSIDSACVSRQMAVLQTRLPAIAKALRSAAGPRVRIVGLTDYDQFLAYWLRGRTGRKFATQSVTIVGDLNDAVAAIYRRAGLRVADAGPEFATTDFTHRENAPGHGVLPRAVARVCNWTWACNRLPAGFNDHANDIGYRVLGGTVVGALRP